VSAELSLCRDGEAVEGTVTLRGRSGVSRRSVKGTWIQNEIRLRDAGFVDSRPSGGWRFCLIDDYTLTVDENLEIVAGWYWSEDCRDRAELTLRRRSR
jgi:hypothetical protein